MDESDNINLYITKDKEGATRRVRELGLNGEDLIDLSAGLLTMVGELAESKQHLENLSQKLFAALEESVELSTGVVESCKERDAIIREHIASLSGSISDIPSKMLVVYEKGRQAQKSIIAKVGASKRHAPNRESKQKVFIWCDENMGRFNSMDDAALDIAETFVPQKFRTVRDWMTEWKKTRATGTT